ncbi:MAG: quinone-dependent dihydroorotate dehydrogenase [Alphaproteobacteria bacterium]
MLAHRLALTLPPKLAHRLAVRALALGLPIARRPMGGPLTLAAGLSFPNPLGLAAGFDKNGVAIAALARMGFGHVEIGTVTPRPQAGNPGPALFRLKADRAIVNRLGMPGDGAEAVARRLSHWREANPDARLRLGVSVGSNRDSTDIAADMAFGVSRFGPVADYLAVNLSSPNTQGLRDWQTGDRLAQVLDAVAAAHARLARRPPLFVKLAPDMTAEDEAALVDRAVAAGLAGLIVCNTTVARPAGLRSPDAGRLGGLSGAPLTARALAQLRRIRSQAGGRLTLIASGGVMSAADALARLDAGAALVQVMTGWVYRGPSLVDEVLAALAPPSNAAASPDSPRSRGLPRLGLARR